MSSLGRYRNWLAYWNHPGCWAKTAIAFRYTSRQIALSCNVKYASLVMEPIIAPIRKETVKAGQHKRPRRELRGWVSSMLDRSRELLGVSSSGTRVERQSDTECFLPSSALSALKRFSNFARRRFLPCERLQCMNLACRPRYPLSSSLHDYGLRL